MIRIALILFGCIVCTSPAIAGDDALAKALKAVTTAKSYQFTFRDGPAAAAVEARYQQGVPLHVVADKIEFFRKDKVLVYKQGDAWQRTRTGTLSDPLRILIPSAKVRDVRLPHEDLARLAKTLTKVKRAKEKGQTILSGDIPADAAKLLARTEDRDLARGGTARMRLDDMGRLTQFEINIRVQGVRGNAEVNGVMTRVVTVAGVNATKVEVPAAAKKVLE